jgi:hypothetical protein
MFLFFQGPALLAHTDVTSQEQFNRVMPGGLPDQLHYNSDRASLELKADDQNCPVSARGFFELNVNSQGEVTRAKDVSRSRSIHPNSMAVQCPEGCSEGVADFPSSKALSEPSALRLQARMAQRASFVGDTERAFTGSVDQAAGHGR